MFDYAVGSETTSDLAVGGIALSSTAAIMDLAGNTASLIAAGANLRLGVNTPESGSPAPLAGTLGITGAEDLELFGASTAAVSFAPGSTGTLTLDALAGSATGFTGTVAGLALGNAIDLSHLAYKGTAPVYTPNGGTGGTLTVTEGTTIAAIALWATMPPAPSWPRTTATAAPWWFNPPAVQQALLTQPHG